MAPINAPALAALIAATFPDLAAERAPHEADVVDRRAIARALVDAGVTQTVSQAAVNQATGLLAADPADQVRDGLAHHLFNILRADRSGSPSLLQEHALDAASYADVLAALVAGGF